MSTVEIAIRIVSGLLLTATNAFFVVTEFALTRLPQLPESQLRGDERLELARHMTERLEIYLTACQLGITSSSILLGVVLEPAVTQLLRPAAALVGLEGAALGTTSVVAAVILINLVHKIWGEQAPTYLGVERPLEVARHTARAHYWWTKVMYPIIKFGDGIAKLTLRAVGVEMQRSWVEAETGGGAEDGGRGRGDGPLTTRAAVRGAMGKVLARGRLPADRRREVMNALRIDEMEVREIMVAREEIVAARVDRPLEDQLEEATRRAHTRVPLVGTELEDFRGVLYLPAALRELDALRRGRITLEELATPALAVPPDMRVSDLIDRFQEAEQEVALVRDDGDEGKVVGLVTTTDAFEAIIGELRDPYD